MRLLSRRNFLLDAKVLLDGGDALECVGDLFAVADHVLDVEVERFEIPNLHALNFLLHESLDGGGTLSLKADAQGKTYSSALLRMEIDVP